MKALSSHFPRGLPQTIGHTNMTRAGHVGTHPDFHHVMLAAVMRRSALSTGMLLCHTRKAELRLLRCKRSMQRFSMCFWARLTGMKSLQARKAAEALLCCILETARPQVAFRALRTLYQSRQPCIARLRLLHCSTCSRT